MRKGEFARDLWFEVEVNVLLFLTAHLPSILVHILLSKGGFHVCAAEHRSCRVVSGTFTAFTACVFASKNDTNC